MTIHVFRSTRIATTSCWGKSAWRSLLIGLSCLGGLSGGVPARGVSPASIEQGRQLFQQTWGRRSPMMGSDGLGPMFNAESCVACHHQGGLGGSGDARFNAKTLSIEELAIAGSRVTDDTIASLVRGFHPGFIDRDGNLSNNLPLHHRGSTSAEELQSELLEKIPASFSPEGGAVDAAEVRAATATAILHFERRGGHSISLQARLFQRNTPSLFGAGLIDQIPNRVLDAVARGQRLHAEISGRPAEGLDGRYGRFGWRANVASLVEFCDRACANELGLETSRQPQPSDPTNPGYRNPGVDVSDAQIRAMADFITALPRPVRELPTEASSLEQVHRGERLFASVGCAVCHVPDLGPVPGLYSDLLLHDMGSGLIDLSPAPASIRSSRPITLQSQQVPFPAGPEISGGGGYFGGAARITTALPNGSRSLSIPSRSEFRSAFRFIAPDTPPAVNRMPHPLADHLDDLGRLDAAVQLLGGRRLARSRVPILGMVSGMLGGENFAGTAAHDANRLGLLVEHEPTRFNQEWRTPPLWGVRDSAPYLHDGRAATLLEAIVQHGGEAAGTRDRFLKLPLSDREAILAFLETLAAPQKAQLAAR